MAIIVFAGTSNKYFSPCTIRYTFTQWTDPKSRFSKTNTVTQKLEGEVELKPGEVWFQSWKFDTSERKELEALGDLKVSAEIRPLEVYENNENVAIKMIILKSTQVKIMPRGYHELLNGSDALEALKEAIDMRIPVVALSGTANETKGIDFVIPCNNKGKKSLAIVYWVLAKEIAKKRKKEFKYTVDDFIGKEAS